MIIKLLSRERAVHSGRWFLFGLGTGIFLLALREIPPPPLSFLPKDFRAQYFFFPALFFWMILMPYMLAYGITERCSRLALTLPISTRRLWLARVLGITLSGLGILGVSASTIVVGEYLAGRQTIDPDLGALIVSVAGCLPLAAMLLQSPTPNLHKLPFSRGRILYIIGVGVGTLLLISWLSTVPPFYSALVAVPAVMLGIRTYRALPTALDLVARQQGDRPDLSDNRPDVRGSVGIGVPFESPRLKPEQQSRWTVHRTVVRTLYNPWLTVLMLTLIVIFGWRNAGYHWSGLSNLTWFFWVIVMLSGLVVAAMAKAPLLDALPISRRLIFAYLVLPGLTVAFLGYTLGMVTGKGMFGNRPLVEYRDMRADPNLDVRVPLEFWEIGRGAAATPALEECCDKPYAAWSVSLLKGTDVVLHNPYHAPADSSPAFVAGQFGRAIEDVYGVQIPAEELQGRYFGARTGGGTELRDDPLNLLEVYPGLMATEWSRSLPSVILAIGLIWLLYLAAGFSRRPGTVLTGHFVLTVIAALSLLTLIWITKAGYTSEWKISAFAGIIARKVADLLPGSTTTLWGIVALALTGCYFLAESRFRRHELPAQPRKA
jgi:hypothetical protein